MGCRQRDSAFGLSGRIFTSWAVKVGAHQVAARVGMEPGTLYGTYQFLERYYGMLFAWHDDLGTITPRQTNLTIRSMHIVDAPDCSYRQFTKSPDGKANEVFGRRLRLGHPLEVRHEHNWHRILSPDVYGQEHPEWFAEINGKRYPKHYAEKRGGQVCTSNPQVVEHFAKAAIAHFNEYPKVDMFSIAANDGRKFCTWSYARQSVETRRLATAATTLRHFWCSAEVFIDATYEGDLLAAAGAEFRLGRESRDEFDEPHAGVVYFDYQTGEFLPGTTGERDSRLPAYTYRLCLTTDSTNAHVLTEPPPDYSRETYTAYFDDLASGRLSGPKHVKPGRGYDPAHFDTMFRALSVTDIPNHKTDVNINPRPLAFPFPEENAGYVEGDAVTRQRICERHRNLTLGLLWFLQNDAEIPEPHRVIAQQYHLPRDEFTDNGHFPFQLYVREARRLIGEYTLTEHDMTSPAGEHLDHADTIAIGEFPIDSFPCRKRQRGDTVVLEGYLGMLDSITRPYGIPYRIMIPKSIDGLIVPVAASTTHVAYSSIRMEPTWMALGQAAGTAAHLAMAHQTQPRTVAIDSLRRHLAADGQVLDHGEFESSDRYAP
jgi:hypothetical protein